MRLSVISCVASLWLWPAAVAAQSGDGPYGNKYSINKLTDDVYTLTWALTPGSPAIGNSTFIIGEPTFDHVEARLVVR